MQQKGRLRMGKPLDVILLAIRPQGLKDFFSMVDMRKIHLITVFCDDGDHADLRVNGERVETRSYHALFSYIERYGDADVSWLISDAVADYQSTRALRDLLREAGVRRERILNAQVRIPDEYQGNLQYAEQAELDYIATGISYMEVGLDAAQLPWRGCNLALSSQDLYYGYRTAADIFAHGRRLRFCLIGLCPYSLGYQMRYGFATQCAMRIYEILLPHEDRKTDDVFFTLLKKPFLDAVAQRTLPPAMNRKRMGEDFPVSAFLHLDREVDDVTVKLRQATFLENMEILRAYIRLCQAHGAKPVAVIFPFAPLLHDRYPQKPLADFRTVLQRMQEETGLAVIDLFDLQLGYECFYDLQHLNARGAAAASKELAEQLKRILT